MFEQNMSKAIKTNNFRLFEFTLTIALLNHP